MHQRSSFVSRLLALSLSLALAVSSAACARVIIDDPGQTLGDDTASDACPAPLPESTFLAISGHDLCGVPLDPGVLLLTIGEGNLLSCEPPAMNVHTRAVSIRISPELQHPGTFTIQRDTTSSSAYVEYCDPTGDGLDLCSGDVFEVTLTILEIDAKHVIFTVTSIDTDGQNLDVHGTHDASRCKK